jgi:rhodanese-related sulfurtransferase/thioredoxin-related protein
MFRSLLLKLYIERLLNIISLLVLVAVGVTVAMRHLRPASVSSPPVSNFVFGQVVPLPDVKLTQPKTLVLVLSTTCHFCQASAPFYKRLLAQQRDQHWEAVAIFPQSESSAVAYMNSHALAPTVTRHGDFNSLRIVATPTLMLLDNKGALLQQWIGQLTPEDQADVARHLDVSPDVVTDPKDNSSATDLPQLDVKTPELASLLATPHSVTILDVRGRDNFAKGHLVGSINIPSAELPIRAIHEVSSKRPVILYCNYTAACQLGGTRSLCGEASERLAASGITNIRYIRDNLGLLEQANIPIEPRPQS